MDTLNHKHLFYFYVVAKEGSVKAAAEKLYVSQPTVSDQIRLLEEFFECKLFVREHRSLSLTKEGKLALKYSEKIFDLSFEITSRLRNRIELPKTTVDIGITPYMANYFLYDQIIPLFTAEDIKVNIQQEERHLLLAELEEGNLDMVITDSKDSLGNQMSAHRIGVNKTFVVAHKKYSKFKKDFPDCLNHIPFFNYTKESELKYEIELFFAKNRLAPKEIGEGDDSELFDLITAKGLAFTIVPEVAKNRMCKDKNIIALGEVEELETYVWGIMKSSYRGHAYRLVKEK